MNTKEINELFGFSRENISAWKNEKYYKNNPEKRKNKKRFAFFLLALPKEKAIEIINREETNNLQVKDIINILSVARDTYYKKVKEDEKFKNVVDLLQRITEEEMKEYFLK